MKKYENGIYRDMTPEDIAAMEDMTARAKAEEKHRALSLGEVQKMLVRAQINNLTVDDQTAYRMRDYYPEWTPGTAYTAVNGCKVGYKVTRGGKLYKLRQEHTSQDSWAPGMTGTESLWERIDEVHDGTKYDPIPYSGSMALENGKYYTQDGVTYLCNRNTGNPVYHPLSALVGLYVEAVSE